MVRLRQDTASPAITLASGNTHTRYNFTRDTTTPRTRSSPEWLARNACDRPDSHPNVRVAAVPFAIMSSRVDHPERVRSARIASGRACGCHPVRNSVFQGGSSRASAVRPVRIRKCVCLQSSAQVCLPDWFIRSVCEAAVQCTKLCPREVHHERVRSTRSPSECACPRSPVRTSVFQSGSSGACARLLSRAQYCLAELLIVCVCGPPDSHPTVRVAAVSCATLSSRVAHQERARSPRLAYERACGCSPVSKSFFQSGASAACAIRPHCTRTCVWLQSPAQVCLPDWLVRSVCEAAFPCVVLPFRVAHRDRVRSARLASERACGYSPVATLAPRVAQQERVQSVCFASGSGRGCSPVRNYVSQSGSSGGFAIRPFCVRTRVCVCVGGGGSAVCDSVFQSFGAPDGAYMSVSCTMPSCRSGVCFALAVTCNASRSRILSSICSPYACCTQSPTELSAQDARIGVDLRGLVGGELLCSLASIWSEA